MQHETLGHDLQDIARLCAGDGCLEQRLVAFGIEAITNLRHDRRDAMFGQHLEQFAQSQLDPLDQGAVGIARGIGGTVQCTAQIVVNGQEVTHDACAAVFLGLAAVPLGAFAHIV